MPEQEAPSATQTADPAKKKKIMYGVLGVGVLVVAYLYFKNQSSSTTAATTTTGNIDPLTGQPYQAGVGSLAQSTGAGIQGMGNGTYIKNLFFSSGGTGTKSGTTATLPSIGSGNSPGPEILTSTAPPSTQQASYAAAQNMSVANTSNAALVNNPHVLFNSSGQATNVGVGTGRSATTGQPAFTGYPTTGPNAVPYATQKAYGWVN